VAVSIQQQFKILPCYGELEEVASTFQGLVFWVDFYQSLYIGMDNPSRYMGFKGKYEQKISNLYYRSNNHSLNHFWRFHLQQL
jgi:hypothetical protein